MFDASSLGCDRAGPVTLGRADFGSGGGDDGGNGGGWRSPLSITEGRTGDSRGWFDVEWQTSLLSALETEGGAIDSEIEVLYRGLSHGVWSSLASDGFRSRLLDLAISTGMSLMDAGTSCMTSSVWCPLLQQGGW